MFPTLPENEWSFEGTAHAGMSCFSYGMGRAAWSAFCARLMLPLGGGWSEWTGRDKIAAAVRAIHGLVKLGLGVRCWSSTKAGWIVLCGCAQTAWCCLSVHPLLRDWLIHMWQLLFQILFCVQTSLRAPSLLLGSLLLEHSIPTHSCFFTINSMTAFWEAMGCSTPLITNLWVLF